ncbi:MAG: hypothetical protein LBL02_00920 [Endomicrobium sp.]|nr:hypothetical protein [Endomicrobium sp.]
MNFEQGISGIIGLIMDTVSLNISKFYSLVSWRTRAKSTRDSTQHVGNYIWRYFMLGHNYKNG